MYANYAYLTGATQANILADLTALLTGETNKANLSASCDQANTVIVSDIAAGWTLHDNAAGSNLKVLKAPLVDDAAQYKYLMLDLATSLAVKIYGYESWNATAHTGTNVTANSTSSYFQRYQTAEPGVLHVFATARMVVIIGAYGSVVGDDNYRGASVYAEGSRLQPWDTVAQGYPKGLLVGASYGFTSSNKAVYASRFKTASNTDVVGTSASLHAMSIGAANGSELYYSSDFPVGSTMAVYDDQGNQTIPLLPFYVGDTTTMAMPLTDLTSVSGIGFAPSNKLANFEIVTINANDYMALPMFSSGSTLVHLLVRKG